MKTKRATQRSHSPYSRMAWKYMQPTTIGTAAMRAYVSRFGSAKARADEAGFVVVVMPEMSTCAPAAQPRYGNGWDAADDPSGTHRRFVEEIVDLACRFGIDSGYMFQIGDRGALDRLQRAEVTQQRALARRTDPGDFLQAGFADVLLALLPVRADREAMRLIAHPLDEVQNRIARAQPERLAARHEEGLPAGIALGPLGDADQGNLGNAERGARLACRSELALAAVDQEEIGPRRGGLVFVVPLHELRYPLRLWERVAAEGGGVRGF